MEPLNDPNLPKILVKEDFNAFMKCNAYLRQWRAVLWNLAVLIASALIICFLDIATNFRNLETGPWWLLRLLLDPTTPPDAITDDAQKLAASWRAREVTLRQIKATLKAAELQPSTCHAIAS